MNSLTTRRIIVLVVGILLLLTPLFIRSVILGYGGRPYTQAEVSNITIAATPVPTSTPARAVDEPVAHWDTELRTGPVIVDLAHGNRLTRSQFEPLASALAKRGVGLRYWLTGVDILSVSSLQDFPDQADELASMLTNASALVVASPFFLWSEPEIKLVERFVADGGRLLLISDPDVIGDLAQDINNLAEPFGVVFNDDYLYDTVENDGNHVHVFQGQFLDQAAVLDGKEIVLYGVRSISGDVTPQVRTASTTLSSMRNGLTDLTTVAIGGLASRSTADKVLVMGDIDVMTMPFVERYDNARLVDYVADFLAAAERSNSVTDFPAFLGREVALIFGSAAAVDAQTLLVGSKLQQRLEESGRILSLSGTTVLTSTLANEIDTEVDLIVLADYGTTDDEMPLLADLGFRLVEVTATPAPGAGAEEHPTVVATAAVPATPGDEVGESLIVTATAEATDTSAADLPVLTPTATLVEASTTISTPVPIETPIPPQVIIYLEKEDGLRLLASETILLAQRELDEGHRIVSVLGSDSTSIRAGVDRLLRNVYEGCVTSQDLAVCSFDGTQDEKAMETPSNVKPDGSASVDVTPHASDVITPTTTPEPESNGDHRDSMSILVVDDDDTVGAGEPSEADTYLQVLTQMAYQPSLWSTAASGSPTLDELSKYTWVIWSSAGYESGGPNLADLDPLLTHISNGGRLTISSRRPFFGMGTDDPSVIADVLVDNDLPELVMGLPAGPIELPNGLPPVVPLETNFDSEDTLVALRRGADSGSAGAPLLFVVTDETNENATGARLMVLGMSLTWFPDDYDKQLVQNMAAVMLADEMP